MQDKFDRKYENQIVLMAETKVKSGNFKVFDNFARVIKRDIFPELARQGRTGDEKCLVIINREGETIVLTDEFERILYAALESKFS